MLAARVGWWPPPDVRATKPVWRRRNASPVNPATQDGFVSEMPGGRPTPVLLHHHAQPTQQRTREVVSVDELHMGWQHSSAQSWSRWHILREQEHPTEVLSRCFDHSSVEDLLKGERGHVLHAALSDPCPLLVWRLSS